MKLLILSIISTAAVACPNLTGSFQCFEDEIGYYIANISQVKNAGITTYKSISEGEIDLIKTDNKWRNIIQGEDTWARKAFCKGNTLGMKMKINDPSAGDVLIDINTIINMSGDMETSGTVTLMGKTFPTETSVCVRQ